MTAAQFVAELYGALAQGRGLGEAVTWARKNLHDKAERRIAYAARPLQDWSVPVVWERAPLRLWPQKPDAPSLKITLDDGAGATPGHLIRRCRRGRISGSSAAMRRSALDRAFDTHRIVLLHAFAGSGKTSTAAEFARWYVLTGGVEGPVLFSSFERHLPLARVLDKIGAVFGEALEGSGIHWNAITDLAQRRRIALQVLQQVPVLCAIFRRIAVDASRPCRAFVEVMGVLASLYARRYQEGHREVLSAIAAEEDNLLAVWRLAHALGRWNAFIAVMQGLLALYSETGRGTAWRGLVNEVVPDFFDPASNGPLAGREDLWPLVTEFRVHLATEERNWVAAERLQQIDVDWHRQSAQPALAAAPDRRDKTQRRPSRCWRLLYRI